MNDKVLKLDKGKMYFYEQAVGCTYMANRG
jgi:hypothetical protein